MSNSPSSDLTEGDALMRECIALRDWLREQFVEAKLRAAKWEPRERPTR